MLLINCRLKYTCGIYTRKQESRQSTWLVTLDHTNIWLLGITTVGNVQTTSRNCIWHTTVYFTCFKLMGTDHICSNYEIIYCGAFCRWLLSKLKPLKLSISKLCATTPNYADQAIAQWSTNHNILLWSYN